MPMPHHLPEPLIELIAQRFRVLGDPMRIRILNRLRDGEASVQELVAATGGSQQNVSKHLSILLSAGIVRRRKQGTRSVYAIADSGVFDLCERVCGGLQRQLSELNDLMEGIVP